MTALSSLSRRTRRDLSRYLWKWTKPKPAAFVVRLNCVRTTLRMEHKSTKDIDAKLRERNHARFAKMERA